MGHTSARWRTRKEGTVSRPVETVLPDEREARRASACLGIDYDGLPPWLTTWELRDLLGLASSNSIERAARMGRIPGAQRLTLRAVREGVRVRGYWQLPKWGALVWAYGRRTGRQPREGIRHLKE